MGNLLVIITRNVLCLIEMSDKNQVKSERCRKECVMRFSDMHVHSTFSSDGKSSMNEHCEIAKQKKLKSICFTEHVDLTRLLRYRQINIHPHSGWYFIFGHSPNTTGGTQVCCLLACQPCNCYLLPINGSRGSNIDNWSLSISLFNWLATYSFIAFVFFPTVST